MTAAPARGLRDLEWIFFDVGNTLMDEGEARRDRDEQLVAGIRRTHPGVTLGGLESALLQAWRAGTARPVETAVASLLGPAHADRALAIVDAVEYRSDLERPFPEANAVLTTLARKFHLGVIANQTRGLRKRLEAFSLGEHISVCVGSADAGLEKPDPKIFLKALTLAGCPPTRAAMVGDRPDNDIAPARALGMWTIRVLQGPASSQRPKAGEAAHRIVRSIAEVDHQ